MDTVMSFRLYAEKTDDAATHCVQLIQDLEQTLSVTDAASPVAQLNASGQGTLPENAAQLLQKTLELSTRTDGALDPTVYLLVCLWGFPTKAYHVPTEAERTEALHKVGCSHVIQDGQTVILTDGAQLDFGAVAKGYAAQCCADYLQTQDIAAILTLGGNVQTVGDKPDGADWQVGIADPDAPETTLATLHLRGTNAIVTSGAYQRYFLKNGVRYHHILDPVTGAPAESGLTSVTIVAADGLLADALSTALFVMGLEEASAFWRASYDFEAVFIDDAGKIFVTEGLADAIFDCDYTVIPR